MKLLNKIRSNPADSIFTIFVYTFMIMITLVVLYPLFFVVIASISDPNLVANGKVLFWPKGITLEGYKYVLSDKRIYTGYYNTIRYTFFGTLIALFITIPAGYALSRRDMAGRGLIMKMLIITKYFSGGLVPTYLVVKGLHLVDTPYVLMILGSFSVFNLILCRTFFMNTLPLELQEAAEIDGCGIFRYFLSIVLPLSKSIVAIMTLYYAVGHWNSFFNGLIYVTDNKLYPLQLILRDILITGQMVDPSTMDPESFELMKQIARTIKYSVIIISSVPVLALYPFVQKHFVKGVMIGSVKG
ncbi:putative aldouronate transport system permease protein [Hungatella effluvii]|uniref:Putative aldouronate transport system permease protein n=1 Tax=Hungatella effluvii TaxID=1096246 RepID=A0A2V3Y009_9FIRM|nr:carbohydrate ABC transporter permease [Hungatella effluvii]PXX51473.1 putative aldouronate transport system permease protein [Hungatella effluvii]